MTKSKLAKITATAITGTALTLGALVTFQGTETIDLAKTTIIELGEKIGIYETNETKLLNKINELNAERDELILRLSEFKGMEPVEINEKIENLENQIEEYETQLSNAEQNAETLAGRILDLEAEILKANTKSEELKTVIDENLVEDEPLSERELAKITGEEIHLTYIKSSKERLTIVEGLQFYEDGGFKLSNKSGSTVSYQNGETGEIRTTNGNGIPSIGNYSGTDVSLVIITLSDGVTYRINVIKK